MENKKLKMIVITTGVYEILFSLTECSHNVIGIIESSRRKKLKSWKNLIQKFIYLFYEITTKKIKTLKTFSQKKNIPYYYMNNGSDEKLENWVKKLKPDVIVVYSMSQLLKKNIFSIPRYWTINLHPSLLPKYRGPNPYFWMYYDYDLKLGMTVHYIDKGEDTGNIIEQQKYSIKPGVKLKDLLLQQQKIGAHLLIKSIDKIANSKNIITIKQPVVSPTVRAKNIKPKKYKELIKWDKWSTERIWHFLRGTENYFLNLMKVNKIIKKGLIVKIDHFKKEKNNGYKISKIYKVNNKRFIVCRDGKIYFRIKFDLKKLISILLN